MSSRHAHCPFEVHDFTPSPWPGPAGGGIDLGQATLHKTFTGGDLEGTSVVLMLSARAGQSAGTYLALERIEGTLHGRTGAFVLQHGATAHGDEREDTNWGSVVEASGTGELAGIRGRCRVVHGLLELDYELP